MEPDSGSWLFCTKSVEAFSPFVLLVSKGGVVDNSPRTDALVLRVSALLSVPQRVH